ncbi:hypothetical protein HPP92_005285 [Vanilla planifolia]|uniref:Nuclear pore complex protein Nup85 n=1 Tax=Vanilla planifolia TaxID=51239 RepID=A0A835VF86_VANPL|nr:hypothetical protein HPP92_005285 [Vanilla planifolia]
MPGRPSDPDSAIVPFSPMAEDVPLFPVRHGLKPPIFRVFVSWSRGSHLQVACVCPPRDKSLEEKADGDLGDEDVGGKVLEVKLGTSDANINEAKRRWIAYGSVPPFALLQGRRNSLAAMSRISSSSTFIDWWKHVLEYSQSISELLGNTRLQSTAVIEDPKLVLERVGEPTSLKAAWQLIEIFYVDRHSFSGLAESVVDWLAEFDCLLSEKDTTVSSKLVKLQEKLVNLQVKLLRLHGSYQLNQLDSRETENGLVEAVAVLVSTMPRLHHDFPAGKLGQYYRTKPDFVKAWEKWRGQISKLDCSAFWVQCGHRQTREGLRNLLQIMLGNINNISAVVFHWIELLVPHLLFIRPLTAGFEEFQGLGQKCMQIKFNNTPNGLVRLFIGILGENTEVVLAECSKSFGPWMVTHCLELLTADNNQNKIFLHEERYNLGGISILELHRLVYAQVLASHPLTSQIAPTYLVSCPKQGLGLLEILLCRQPVQHHQIILKNLEICRLYELDGISSCIKKIAGIYHWKHGRKGAGIYWLQEARDEATLNHIAHHLFESIGRTISDESFKQWEGLIELLGPDVGSAGGLGFLHTYRDFKKSLKLVESGRTSDVARQAIEALIQLLKSPSTPQRFWFPLLHDSLKLLNWRERPLLNVSETNLLLNKLQELSMAKLRPDFCSTELQPNVLSSVRLALARNLSRAFLEE